MLNQNSLGNGYSPLLVSSYYVFIHGTNSIGSMNCVEILFNYFICKCFNLIIVHIIFSWIQDLAVGIFCIRPPCLSSALPGSPSSSRLGWGSSQGSGQSSAEYWNKHVKNIEIYPRNSTFILPWIQTETIGII